MNGLADTYPINLDDPPGSRLWMQTPISVRLPNGLDRLIFLSGRAARAERCKGVWSIYKIKKKSADKCSNMPSNNRFKAGFFH